MDFLTLYLAASITGKKTSRTRLVAASAFGGLSGTVSMFFLSGVLYIVTGLVIAAGMTLIAFGRYKSPIRLLRDSIILWGAGTLLGGVMTCIMSLGTAVYLDYGNDGFAPLFLICFGVSAFFVRLTKNVSSKKSAVITVTAGGVTASFTALCDSGCLLTDPISGIPVIIASDKSLGELSDILAKTDTSLRIRMIPANGVCGHKLLRGFVPDAVSVDGKAVSAVVASDDSGSGYGGFDGIVPTKLTRSA